MAEEKTLTLAQQYSLKEKEESSKHDEISVEAIADVPPTSAAPSDVVDATPAKAVVQEAVETLTSAPAEATVTESLANTTPEEAVAEKTEETATAVESSEAPEEEKADAEETPEEIKLETAPADFRFPTTNQSRHCFTRYIEYHRCIAAKGDDAPECNKFAKYYRALCPGEWVDKWNEQRENGTFPGPL